MAEKRFAGKSTREMADERYKSRLKIGIIGIVIIIIFIIIVNNGNALGIGGLGILGLLLFMRLFSDYIEGQMDKKIKLEKRAIRGAKAEERVGELLDELSYEDFFVINDVESKYGNIDHLVIGKNCGIFLLETKAHGGRVEVDGDNLLVNGKFPEKNFVSQALQNSYWVRDQIGEIVGSKPWITPVIVFTNAFVVNTKPLKGVYIINKKYLLPLLLRSNKPNSIMTKIWDTKEDIESALL